MSGWPTRATIDLRAIRANFAEARRRAEARELLAVVKADAYGHGAPRVSRALVEAGCRRFAVASVAEGAELRDAGIREPILILGGVFDAEESEAAVGLDLTPAVFHAGQVALLAAAARDLAQPLDVHVAVDTGMRRTGVPQKDALALLEAVVREPALHLGGVYSHLARADEPDLAPSLEQLRALGELLAQARERGLDPGLIHVAHSAGLLAGKPLIEALPEQAAARPGVMLYGVSRAEAERTLAVLDWREKGGYERQVLDVHVPDQARIQSGALTYLAMPENPDYLGETPLSEIAAQVRASHGPSGANLEYALRLAEALREMGADDEHVFGLEELLKVAE